MTYEREVAHCSRSAYVKEVTVKEILPVAKADTLDIVRFKEAGWQVVVKRGTVKVGEKYLFIPPESVLPLELSDALDVTKYLSKGKVKVVKMRGEYSEGLLADKAVCEPYLDYILQWEDVPAVHMTGTKEVENEISDDKFPVFYKIPNLLNEPDTFNVGDKMYVSEKIHGTNCRFGYLKANNSRRYKLFVGSHKVVLKDPDYKPTFLEKIKNWLTGKKAVKGKPNVYWSTVRKVLKNKVLPKDVVFYGEIYGEGVQDLDYDVPKNDLRLRIFASWEKGLYHPFSKTAALCKQLGLETVPVNEPIKYTGIENAIKLSQAPSALTKKHIREGVVLRGADQPRKWAKVVSPEYLARKGKTTERH